MVRTNQILLRISLINSKLSKIYKDPKWVRDHYWPGPFYLQKLKGALLDAK